MELSILHAIQTIHNPVLDKIMVLVFNNLVGSLGQLWIVVGVVLLLIPKTRKCGAAVLLSYALSLLIGNEWLKDWIARPRPCAVDETVALIVKKPSSFSCPSVHTYLHSPARWRFTTITKKQASACLYLRHWSVSAECTSSFTTPRMCCSARFWAL